MIGLKNLVFGYPEKLKFDILKDFISIDTKMSRNLMEIG